MTGLPLSGKTALVTGAARGIGRAIALDLARLGADVFITYRGSEAAANGVADEVRALGVECRVSQLDVRSAADIDEEPGFGPADLTPTVATRYPGMLHGFFTRVNQYDDAAKAITEAGHQLRISIAAAAVR